ncbi:ribbon-helix-helix protein, CopG family [Candidatus Poriferisocius sp.]|uniref:ribbon-helix-helix protein, CopG family n=1 Tax=Candidatus Poriferisocius sp. TaxID=3101276 RepID=UPI003B59D167
MTTKLLTVRVETELWDAAARRAETLGISVSEVVREALREAVDNRPLVDRIGHLRGSVRTDSTNSSQDIWKSEIRAHNWRS